MRIRASQAGRLMTGRVGLTERQSKELERLRTKLNDTGKITDRQMIEMGRLIENSKPVLGETTKSLIDEIYISQEFGRHKEIQSKYLTKGIEVEENSITLLTNVTGSLFVKNKKRVTNDYFTGEWDLNTKETVEDIKSSWDIHTFHKAEVTKDNYWQIQIYMDLSGKRQGVINYCLNDTPDHIINDEFRRLAWKLNAYDDDFMHNSAYDQLRYQVAKNMLFTDEAFDIAKSAYFSSADTSDWVSIPEIMRVKRFFVDYSEGDIIKARERVEMARKYYQTITL